MDGNCQVNVAGGEGDRPQGVSPLNPKLAFWGTITSILLADKALTKLVPVQLEDGAVLYIEAQSEADTTVVTPSIPYEESGEQRRGGAKGIGIPAHINPTQSLQMVQSTIRTYTVYCLNAFKNISPANVDEVTLEFGVNFSADAGIPYIASGKAQSNLKITVKCSFDKSEPQITEQISEQNH